MVLLQWSRIQVYDSIEAGLIWRRLILWSQSVKQSLSIICLSKWGFIPNSFIRQTMTGRAFIVLRDQDNLTYEVMFTNSYTLWAYHNLAAQLECDVSFCSLASMHARCFVRVCVRAAGTFKVNASIVEHDFALAIPQCCVRYIPNTYFPPGPTNGEFWIWFSPVCLVVFDPFWW